MKGLVYIDFVEHRQAQQGVVVTEKPLQANRRLAARRVTDVKVFASDGGEIKKCRLRDISLDGAYIETKNFTLAKGTKLDLVLRILSKGQTTACPLPAEVIRTEKGGAALVFTDLDEDANNILVDIVRPPRA